MDETRLKTSFRPRILIIAEEKWLASFFFPSFGTCYFLQLVITRLINLHYAGRNLSPWFAVSCWNQNIWYVSFFKKKTHFSCITGFTCVSDYLWQGIMSVSQQLSSTVDLVYCCYHYNILRLNLWASVRECLLGVFLELTHGHVYCTVHNKIKLFKLF